MRSFIFHLFLILFLIITGCDNDDSPPTTPGDSNNTTKIVPNDFLSEQKYNKLIVEIQYIEGFAPTATTVSNLQDFLEQRLNKSAGITITQKAIPSTGKQAYTADDIRSVEKVNRTQHAADKTLTAYFFFADSDYAGNTGDAKVLGIAYGSSSMAIFEKTIHQFSGDITQPPATTVETAVVLHEFGHILGLVNNGTSMASPHQDEPHGKHCNNEQCLMYYATETSDIITNLVGGNIPTLDTQCLNDLRANGGK